MGRGSGSNRLSAGAYGGSKNQQIDLETATAAQIQAAINQADDIDTLDNIIETIANNDTITNAEYTQLYQNALTKAQGWQPTANAGILQVSNTNMSAQKREQVMDDYARELSALHNTGGSYNTNQLKADAVTVDNITKKGDTFAVWSNVGSSNNGWIKTGADKWERWSDAPSSNVTRIGDTPITTSEMLTRMNTSIGNGAGRYRFNRNRKKQ